MFSPNKIYTILVLSVLLASSASAQDSSTDTGGLAGVTGATGTTGQEKQDDRETFCKTLSAERRRIDPWCSPEAKAMRARKMDEFSSESASFFYQDTQTGDSNYKEKDYYKKNNLAKDAGGWSFQLNGMVGDPLVIQKLPLEKEAGIKQNVIPANELYRQFTIQDLSNDNQVVLTSMAQFQPLSAMRASAVENQEIVDQHMQLFSTLKGVSDLTLAYLDKTVASGLNAVQNQADAQVTQMLLKQISWAANKQASPELSHAFANTEMALQNCMQQCNGEFVPGVCDYAGCLAKVEQLAGKKIVDPFTRKEMPDESEWSLVRKVFGIPQGIKLATPPPADIAPRLKYACRFATHFGDLTTRATAGATGGNALNYSFRAAKNAPAGDETRTTWYIDRFARRIERAMVCAVECYDKNKNLQNSEEGIICQATEVSRPICMYSGANEGSNVQNIACEKMNFRVALERASLGANVTFADIMHVSSMPESTRCRFIENFSGNSAIVAYSKYLRTMAAQAEDIFVTQRMVPENEKELVRGLTTRAFNKINYAFNNMAAESTIKTMLLEAWTEYDKRRLAEQEAAAAANQSGRLNTGTQQGLKGYGRPGSQ